jgi:ribosome-binding protein aMBF1 (putative translation factor)
MNIGFSIKSALMKSGNSREWLAGEMKVSITRINKLALSEAATTDVVKRLADAFEMKASEFIALGE